MHLGQSVTKKRYRSTVCILVNTNYNSDSDLQIGPTLVSYLGIRNKHSVTSRFSRCDLKPLGPEIPAAEKRLPYIVGQTPEFCEGARTSVTQVQLVSVR